ncbi:MAG: tripartite tricarboxylate transporter substrate binding protein [Bacillota bacterium]
MARALQKVIVDNKLLPVTMVVSNKPGGSGAIGWAHVAGRKGDSHVIATVSSSFYTQPLIGGMPVSYQDFTPICGLAMDTLVLLVNSKTSKFFDIKELLAWAKDFPRALTVGGTGGTSDDAVANHMLSRRAGVEFRYVPFASGGEAMTALLGGHVDIVWANPGEALSQMQAGRARPLAVASPERLALLPNVPTFKESGVDIVLAQFRGIVAPKDISPESAAYLENLFRKVSETRDWQEGYIKPNMLTSRFLGANEFAQAIPGVIDMYRTAFEEMGLIKK